MKIICRNNWVWKDFSYCTNDCCFKVKRKETQLFRRVLQQWHAVSFLSGKSATRTGNMQVLRYVLPRATCKLYNWASCLGQFSNVPSRRKKFTLLIKYLLPSPASTRFIFHESSVQYIGRNIELFVRRKRSSEKKKTIFEQSSGFCSVPRTFFAFLDTVET